MLRGAESGIEHIHGLGWIHNDINLNNVMLDNNGAVVIIAFGSCCRGGESLEDFDRTYGWHDKQAGIPMPASGFGTVHEICLWLGDDAEPFPFLE